MLRKARGRRSFLTNLMGIAQIIGGLEVLLGLCFLNDDSTNALMFIVRGILNILLSGAVICLEHNVIVPKMRFKKWMKYVEEGNFIQTMKKDAEFAYQVYSRDPLQPMFDYVKELNPDVVKIIAENKAFPKYKHIGLFWG